MSDRERYARLFGEPGATLSDAEWIAQANDSLPPNLSALNARIDAGSRRDKDSCRSAIGPSRDSFTYIGLSGGCIAEMLDQAAAHCATFVTGHGCPTLTLIINYLRAGTWPIRLSPPPRLSTVTERHGESLNAELTDERGRRITSASIVVHLIKDITRFND